MQTPDATLELGDAAAQRQNALLAQTPSLIQELGSLLHSNNQIANPQWLKSILEVTAKYFPLTDAGIITLFDKTTGFDEVVADYIKDDSLYMNIHLRTFEGTTKTCYENMESRIINNENRPLGFIDDDELLSREELFKEILKPDFLYSSVMCCPLQFDGQILGAIQLEHSGNDNSFSEFELQVLDHLVAHPLAEVLYRYGLSDFICHRNR